LIKRRQRPGFVIEIVQVARVSVLAHAIQQFGG